MMLLKVNNFLRAMFCLLATLIYLLGELPNFRSKTRIQSIVSDLANQNQSQAAGSILKEIIQKSFEEIKDDFKEIIQDQAKQPFQQNKKTLLNQDLFETKIDQLKKELKQTQLQQFHEIRNQQRQLFNQQSRETKVSLMLQVPILILRSPCLRWQLNEYTGLIGPQEYALWQYRLSIFQWRVTKFNRFLAKNQQNSMKLSFFVNRRSTKVQKSDFQSQFSISKMI